MMWPWLGAAIGAVGLALVWLALLLPYHRRPGGTR